MAVFKFEDNDIFVNTLEANPETSFYIHSGTVSIDSIPSYMSGAVHSNILHVDRGHISLYEMNIDRLSGDENQITASIVAIGEQNLASNTTTVDNYGVDFYPDSSNPSAIRVNLSYNLSSSIYQFYYPATVINEVGQPSMVHPINQDLDSSAVSLNENGRVFHGFKNASPKESLAWSTGLGYDVPYSINGLLSKYSFRSPHFAMVTEGSLHQRDLRTVEACFLNIPSIFYGSKIKRNTVELNYYVSGSVIGTLKDRGGRGELIQTGPQDSEGSGSVAGLIFYQEGLIILTGSWALGTNNSISYVKNDGSSTGNTTNKWTHFASGLHQDLSSNAHIHSASYTVDYQGTTRIPTVTMLCKAPYTELNWSNNPTFVKNSGSYNGKFTWSSNTFKQIPSDTANITDTDLVDYEPQQVKETYISKVAIYDKEKNLIGVAKVANPVRKTPDRSYLFKLKLDL